MVLILLLTMVGVVGTVALVSTGILTSEKMQLQNAADATAYSVSVLEARDLNYSAYMNRAMVANEVAIGQMVSMMSWANMTRSTPEFMDDYAAKIDVIISAVTLGTATGSMSSSMRAITTPLRTVSNLIHRVVDAFTGPVATAMSVLNRVYNISQTGYHFMTFLFSASALADVPDMNAEDADYSLFGGVALARHFVSYYGGAMPGFPDALYSSVSHYRPGSDDEGMRRLAQVINDSRDGFTKNRRCGVDIGGNPTPPLNFGIGTVSFTPPGVNCRPNNFYDTEGGWDATLFGFRVEIDVFLLIADFSFRAGIGRQGGTDLREGTNGSYTWSAADTTDPRVQTGGGFQLCIGIPFIGRVCSPRAGFDFDPPLPPFGVGAALAGNPAPNMADIPFESDARDIMYGGASRNVLAWDFVLPPFVPTPDAIRYIRSVRNQITQPNRNIYRNYDLRGYVDTQDVPAIGGFTDPDAGSGDWMTGMEAPYLLIALTKDDVVQGSQSTSGRFALDGPRNGLLGTTVPFGVIAKSEVYYSRPGDLSYFDRGDGREEAANAFNPYWQARLVDTSYIDRTAALAFQHGQIPLPAEAFTIINQAQSLINQLLP